MLKYLVSAIIATFLVSMANAQSALTKTDSVQISEAAVKLSNALNKKTYASENEKKFDMEFAVDTFKVEKAFNILLNKFPSTSNQIYATNEANNGYDKLLNKYYKILMNKLQGNDKTALRNAERSWMAYRDNEIKLSTAIAKKDGGEIGRLAVISERLDLTQKRVVALYDYIEQASIY